LAPVVSNHSTGLAWFSLAGGVLLPSVREKLESFMMFGLVLLSLEGFSESVTLFGDR
jgi:hypothetical protein